jgi:hypothetical protein
MSSNFSDFIVGGAIMALAAWLVFSGNIWILVRGF